MRLSAFRTMGGAVTAALVVGFIGVQASADGPLSALPNVGASQTYSAAQQFSIPGGGFLPPGAAANGKGPVNPHDQSGTLTITRVASDSIRVSASDGLDAFDQTLHVDAQGSVAQSSPANPFIDELDNVAAILAAAPSNQQKGATWSVKLPTPSWIAAFMPGSTPKEFSSVPVTVTVAAVTGDTTSLHGEGKVEVKVGTGLGTQTNRLSIAADCTLHSGHLKSCSRTTSFGYDLGASSMGFSETTTLTAK